MRLGRAITALTLLSLSDPVAWPQPTRAIKIVVPYQPGGTNDVLAHLTFVPYPGGAPTVNALLGEHVTSAITDYPPIMEQLKAGKLRTLATGSRKRITLLPNVPTVVESGYKDYEVDFWIGLFAPAKTPNETVSQLGGWFTAAMQVPEIKIKLAEGLYPAVDCGTDFAALLRKQYGDYGAVIRESNMKAE